MEQAETARQRQAFDGTGQRVFISHASADKGAASALCEALESLGHRCWIAPRDIPPGSVFADAIIEAINDAAVLLVVFSASANRSTHVAREVERATAKHCPVIPLRIENVSPEGGLEYLLSSTQWLDIPQRPGASDLAALEQALHRLSGRSVPAQRPAAKAFRRRWAVPFGIAALLLVLGGAYLALRSQPVHTIDKSVAVLPFENLSADPDNAFFTDGLQDTVIGHLARVHGLKVISRTSVMGFRGKQDNLRKIGELLGVAQILEGSVQRSGGKLRVVVQLIDAANDTHLWSQEYNRDLSDVFAVQADIAQRVAEAINAQLTPQEKARIEAIPTTSQEAYDLYLKAVLVERSYGVNLPKVREAIVWLDQAVKLDPKFALAYALLTDMHDRLNWFGADYSAERRELASAAADNALRLGPGLAEAHAAKALVLYHGNRDYEGALRELEIARGIAPGHARAHFWLGAIYRRQGKWEQSLQAFEQAARLDPLNESFMQDHAGTLTALGRYAEADKVYERMIEVARDKLNAQILRIGNDVSWRGDLDRTEAALKALPANDNPVCAVSDAWAQQRFLQRRFVEAAALNLSCHHDSAIPIEYTVAQMYELAGDLKQARHYAQIAKPAILEGMKGRGQTEGLRQALSDILRMEGDRAGALRELKQSLEEFRKLDDAVNRPGGLYGLAEGYAFMGEKERALELLEEVFTLPGVSAHFARLDPFLDSLRDEPRFKKLIADHLPPAPSP